jgi:hypothetical protein
MFRLLVCMAFALTLIGCGSQQLPTTSSDAAKRNSAQTASLLTLQSSLLWEIDGDSRPPNWKRATDGDCGKLQFPTDSSVYFDLKKDGTSCSRDQLNPWGNHLWQLTPGQTYKWRYETITHMGVDRTPWADRLVWQEHQGDAGSNGCPLSPITSLHITTDGSSVQKWWFEQNGHVAELPYSEGATDDWVVQAKIADNSTGWTKAWHDGKLILSTTGPNYPAGCAAPFFNFGPYEWQWTNPKIHDSLTEVAILFRQMRVSRL